MLALSLALTASVSWGIADYLGGVKSRIVPLLTLIAVSQLAGLALTAAIAGATCSFPSATTALYAALAGCAGLVGLAGFYRGMAVGQISIIAPVSATGVIIPIVFGLSRGERPGQAALAGVGLALAGVVLVSAERTPAGAAGISAGVPLALAAAIGFGSFFLLVAKASEGGQAIATTFMLRGTTVPLVLLALAFSRSPARIPSGDLGWLLLLGVLDSGANILYALASERGLLTLVSVLGSLYPLTTILLAQTLLKERISRHQKLGVVVALAGVALISAR